MEVLLSLSWLCLWLSPHVGLFPAVFHAADIIVTCVMWGAEAVGLGAEMVPFA